MKSKNDLKIGDRVRVVDDPTITRPTGYEVMARIEGTVKELSETHVGVEFDYYADVKNNSWNGRFWRIPYDYLEKIEDTGEETKEVEEETKVEKMNIDKEMVNHPLHYTSGKVECIDAIESATGDLTGIEAVCTANIIKYVWRWKLKNGVEDLEKAKWYLNKLIEQAKGEK